MSCLRSCALTITLTGLALLASGCGAKAVPVKGVVTLEGKALPNASVIFHTQDPAGRDAFGCTDVNGVFQLSTFSVKDGALPGVYKVTVDWSEQIAVPAEARTPADVQSAQADIVESRRPSLVISSSYRLVDQTILKHKVPDDGEPAFDVKREEN